MSRPIAKSTRRVTSRLWIPIPLLALAACGNGGTLSGSSSTVTSRNTSNGGGGGGTFYWTIAFTVSGLDTGASLVVLLNGTYARVVTKNWSPPEGWYLFAPGTPASFTGLPRSNAASWIDSAGTLWLFGGSGIDSTGAAGILNDLWQFTPSTGTWTWVSGSIMAAAGSAV
jgi:galactose oxidase-like protein